jgi:hypothetical protein
LSETHYIFANLCRFDDVTLWLWQYCNEFEGKKAVQWGVTAIILLYPGPDVSSAGKIPPDLHRIFFLEILYFPFRKFTKSVAVKLSAQRKMV